MERIQLNSKASITAGDPSHINPIDIVKENERIAAQQEAQLKADEATAQAAQEREDKRNASLVPGLLKELDKELNQLYQLFVNADRPELKRARLVQVIDLSVDPTLLSRLKSWWHRRFGPPGYQPPHSTKETACWEATWLRMSDPTRIILVFIDVTDGSLYYGSLEHATFDGRVDVWLKQLSYSQVSTLIEWAQGNAHHLRHNIRHQQQKQ